MNSRSGWEMVTERARAALWGIEPECSRLGCSGGAAGGLLLAMFRDPQCAAVRLLARMGVSPERIKGDVEKQVEVLGRDREQREERSARLTRAIREAFAESSARGDRWVGTEHLLIGLTLSGDRALDELLAVYGVNTAGIRAALGPPRKGV